MSKAVFSEECLQLAGRLVENLTFESSTHVSVSDDVTKGLATTVLKFLSAYESISLPDSETGIADSIRFYLRSQGDRFPYSSTVRFDELYQKLLTCMPDHSSFRAKSLLLLLSLARQRVSERAKNRQIRADIVTTDTNALVKLQRRSVMKCECGGKHDSCRKA